MCGRLTPNKIGNLNHREENAEMNNTSPICNRCGKPYAFIGDTAGDKEPFCTCDKTREAMKIGKIYQRDDPALLPLPPTTSTPLLDSLDKLLEDIEASGRATKILGERLSAFIEENRDTSKKLGLSPMKGTTK